MALATHVWLVAVDIAVYRDAVSKKTESLILLQYLETLHLSVVAMTQAGGRKSQYRNCKAKRKFVQAFRLKACVCTRA